MSVSDCWAELLAEIGAECDMGPWTWCSRHQSSGRNGRCSTGRAIDEMAAALTPFHTSDLRERRYRADHGLEAREEP